MASSLLPGELRLRILCAEDIAMGPGKADLLDAIQRTGSIAAAGRELGMSYRRAWLLVDTMNRSFSQPVVVAAKGGAHGGGAEVTPFGREALGAYRQLLALLAGMAGPEVAAFRKAYLRKAQHP